MEHKFSGSGQVGNSLNLQYSSFKAILEGLINRPMKKFFVLFMLLACSGNSFAHEGASNNHIHTINTNYRLYQQCKGDVEGYAAKLSGGEYDYPSLRDDHRDAMISRATTGKNGFEFMTGKVPEDYKGNHVTFFFYSDVDLNKRQPYDVKVNDRALLTFRAREDGTMEVLENPGNGKIEYILVKRDGNGDGVGALRLTVPKSIVKNGTQAKISVYGHHKGSNSWFMIFKVPDAVAQLAKSATQEVSFRIRQFNDMLLIDAPLRMAGKSVQLVSDKKKSEEAIFKVQGELAKASVKIAAPQKSFAIHFEGDVFYLKVEDPSKDINQSEVIGEFVYHVHSHASSDWSMTFSKFYRPKHFETYTNFFDAKYAKSKVSIMNSSHQDIAWVDRPEVCIIMRDTLLLTPVLKDAFERADYGFDVEDALMLREYMDRHPDAKDKISELLKRQLLSIGATYNCPYEDMYSGEDLVRQLYVGKRWLKSTFDGYDSKVYWNVDVPGKTLQMPQILKKAGVDYMIISRHAKSFFHWGSPDGSSVFTYSPGHYGTDLIHLSQDRGNQLRYGAEQVVWWGQYSEEKDHYTPLLSSQDMLPAIDYSEFIEAWNEKESIKDAKKKKKKIYLPDMELMTVDEFMPLAAQNVDLVDTIVGERPNVWVYIHGPTHHTALTASREGSKLLTAAEKFSTASYLLDKSKMPYPTAALDQAWQDKVYPDHGWGGHDGDITDGLFESKFVSSRVQGQQLLDKALTFLSSRVNTKEDKGIPVVIFNSLSWERTDPVTIDIDLPQGVTKSISIKDAGGRELTSQVSDLTTYGDGFINKAKLTFIAEKVPSVGYKTFYLHHSTPGSNGLNDLAKEASYENPYYQLTFTEGGLSQVYDKDLKKNLFLTNDFKTGEIFTLESVGNGAGEFGDIQQPFMNDFDKVSIHAPKVEIIENGSVFTTYRIKQQILHAIAQQDITIYHKLKRVQFDNKLLNWNGELYREFRTAYPVNMKNATITYDVPFGSVQVGRDEIHTAGERYTPLCKDVHPRAIMDWISASDGDMTVTLSSSVAAADWIDPTKENDRAVLQHLLLASRKSCHWEGNLYSQEGSHSYSHIVTSAPAGDRSGGLVAEQFNEPLFVVYNPDKSSKANLSDEESFFTAQGKDVIVSAIKKAEDSDDVVFRLYNREGESTNVNINSYFEYDRMFQTNIIEEEPKEVKQLSLGKYAIETVILDVK
ncbi:hypothetical protein FNH22_08345 [Fulvivirga sp. M361]|uniref:glycoside hydrolase family 38 N-terminal domain-containing protein n=1 Tax=Fulvivirga sp. M361 TaxID=2594266 RepID=UPI00117BDCD4|nr:glycosyl hydrolase-related protein [Fulvivirga sp. M361]TRX60050.1 hypothetical protein FNH22_08345 [Fulvivirga sp. M361]